MWSRGWVATGAAQPMSAIRAPTWTPRGTPAWPHGLFRMATTLACRLRMPDRIASLPNSCRWPTSCSATRRRMPAVRDSARACLLRLRGHASRRVQGAVRVVRTGALDDLEEEPVGKALGVDVEVVAIHSAIEQDAERAHSSKHQRRDVEA